MRCHGMMSSHDELPAVSDEPGEVSSASSTTSHPPVPSEEYACENPSCVESFSSVLQHSQISLEEQAYCGHSGMNSSVVSCQKVTQEEHACDINACVESCSSVLQCPRLSAEEHACDNNARVESCGSVSCLPAGPSPDEHDSDNKACVDSFSSVSCLQDDTSPEEHNCDSHSAVESSSSLTCHSQLSPEEHAHDNHSFVDSSRSVSKHPRLCPEENAYVNHYPVDSSRSVSQHQQLDFEKLVCGDHSPVKSSGGVSHTSQCPPEERDCVACHCHLDVSLSVLYHPRLSAGEQLACDSHSAVHVDFPAGRSITAEAEKGPSKRQATRRCRLYVAIGVVLALAVIISLSVIFAGNPDTAPDVVDTSTFPPPRALDPQMLKDPDFEGSFRMTGTKWDPAMSDVNTNIFRNTASKTEGMIDEIYRSSNVSDVIQYSVVTSLREGSVVVCFILHLTAMPDLMAYPAKVALRQRVKAQPSLLTAAFAKGLDNVLSSARNTRTYNRIVVSSLTIRRVNTTQLTSALPTTTTPVSTTPTTTGTRTTTFTTSETIKTPEEEPRCGAVRRPPEARIIGGSRARQGTYPWVVMIRVDDRLHCGGSIMDPLHVITAAHCFASVDWPGIVHNTEVVAGEHAASPDSWTEHVQQVDVTRIYRHALFNLPTQSHFESNLNDIAVIRLARPLTFNSYVAPVCLPDVNDTLPIQCLVAGWGTNTTKKVTFSEELQAVMLWTYNKTTCQETFAASFNGVMFGDDISYYLSDGVMCAANRTSGGMDACSGDSGGPLFCLQEDPNGQGDHYTQFGIVSWGEGCAEPRSPGFYAYLPYFKTWLLDVALPKLDFLVNTNVTRCLSERKCVDTLTNVGHTATPDTCKLLTAAVDCMVKEPVKYTCNRELAVTELWTYLRFLNVPSTESPLNLTACMHGDSG